MVFERKPAKPQIDPERLEAVAKQLEAAVAQFEKLSEEMKKTARRFEIVNRQLSNKR